MLICIPLAFYYQIASRVVELVDLPVGTTMSYGQISEIVFMLVMPLFFARLGVKWMLAVGMLAWVLRYALFALGAPTSIHWMIIGGIVLHGICYDFFFVTGQIYTDKKAPAQMRAQAQGLLVMLTLGLGMLIGAQVAGKVEAHYTPSESIAFGKQVVEKSALATQLAEVNAAAPSDETQAQLEKLTTEIKELKHSQLAAIQWRELWAIPAAFALAVLIFFVLLFKDRTVEETAHAAQPLNKAALLIRLFRSGKLYRPRQISRSRNLFVVTESMAAYTVMPKSTFLQPSPGGDAFLMTVVTAA